jgi:hypothetical protein
MSTGTTQTPVKGSGKARSQDSHKTKKRKHVNDHEEPGTEKKKEHKKSRVENNTSLPAPETPVKKSKKRLRSPPAPTGHLTPTSPADIDIPNSAPALLDHHAPQTQTLIDERTTPRRHHPITLPLGPPIPLPPSLCHLPFTLHSPLLAPSRTPLAPSPHLLRPHPRHRPSFHRHDSLLHAPKPLLTPRRNLTNTNLNRRPRPLRRRLRRLLHLAHDDLPCLPPHTRRDALRLDQRRQRRLRRPHLLQLLPVRCRQNSHPQRLALGRTGRRRHTST